jgi:hypothetical protein
MGAALAYTCSRSPAAADRFRSPVFCSATKLRGEIFGD